MANPQNIRSKFLLSEFFTLSISGALQRANVYASGASADDKNAFKKDLKGRLNTLIESYFEPISEEQHIDQIKQLRNFTANYPKTLKNEKLSFGVSQHILNLFLKYIWCLKLIPNPPHFPIDGTIQTLFNDEARKIGLAEATIIPWTKINDAESYLKIINFAKQLISHPTNESASLAEFELSFYTKKS